MKRCLMIKFEEVSVTYPGGVYALRNFSLEIQSGEFIAFVGASGSGKTTALRLVNRMQEPTSGRILKDGVDLAGLNPIALRREIGYVIQSAGLIPHMTIGQNVGLVPTLLGETREKVRTAVEEGLRQVRLTPEKFSGRYPNMLSGGQKQRVGIARALAANPDVILMDEPFGALDNVLREEIQDEFNDIFSGVRQTILFVTHDMHEAVHMADRIIVMKDGQSVQEGTPQDIVLRPNNSFVEKLLGRRRKALEDQAREGKK
jgi:osmoprotectant transport system ATP-binding protein